MAFCHTFRNSTDTTFASSKGAFFSRSPSIALARVSLLDSQLATSLCMKTFLQVSYLHTVRSTTGFFVERDKKQYLGTRH